MSEEKTEIACAFCGELFIPKRHNMKYCKNECCREATNQKLVAKYHEKKNTQLNKVKSCKICDSKLSRYNDGDICSICSKRERSSYREEILRELGYAN